MNKINMAILGPGGIAKSMAKAMAGLANGQIKKYVGCEVSF